MFKKRKRFSGVVGEYCSSDKDGWNRLVSGNGEVVVSAHSSVWAEIEAGELTTGFLHFKFIGGCDATIRILTSEGYVLMPPDEINWAPLKGRRTDWQNGFLHGFTDTIRLSGNGIAEFPEEYTPFWWRTFRYLRLEIETGENPLTICNLDYTETGYPLEVKTEVSTSDESLTDIWDISLRSLRHCMQETYVDCPFYEQLQYLMDTRTQILYTYSVSADDRLARETIEMFSHAGRYDGLLNCSYPNTEPNIIPGFSIYFIFMLHDHMMYFGDKKFLRKYVSTVDTILEYFNRNILENGLVGKLGTINNGNYWLFIDWSPSWKKTDGMPSAGVQGPVTMESLLYIMGLQHAAELNDYLGRHDTAKEYQQRAILVQNAVNTHCRDEEGFYIDGPAVMEYSAHSQIFAILSETVEPEKGKFLLAAALDDTGKFVQCSVATYFYLYRALEKTDLYERTETLWDLWRDMLKKDLTTCVENQTDERSDCHAWGALALYELPSVILGVRPAAPGYERMSIKPVCGYLEYAEGTVITPKGKV